MSGGLAAGDSLAAVPRTAGTHSGQDQQNAVSQAPPGSIEDNVGRLYTQAAELLMSKHHDYGPNNIALSPGGALNGVLVRLHDKMSRLGHLYDNRYEAKHESFEDTLIDLANYALIGVLVLRRQWPNLPKSRVVQ